MMNFRNSQWRFRLSAAALIPVLLLSVLAASAGLFNSTDADNSTFKIERQEHKMTHAAWKKTTLLKHMPLIRPVQQGTTSWIPGTSAAVLLAGLLLPVIYLCLKRLLLRPLKYTSHYVDSAACLSV
ncbi:hypothetical protein [Paenibacillus tepidiphilus]|uniref:hypothetical protein n=1 Tax=Paenibacillus tepidiphilus TaxID=2608683 RepID=UPI0012389E86|nr:hypothetical protein [Paenibacillus tepidiphilus]